jgi:DNA-binding IclR family transcriptional regulator
MSCSWTVCAASAVGGEETVLDLDTGSRLPAYRTSIGKLLLANLPEGE